LLNEEDSLPELALQLEDELNRFAKDRWEVIFVDDGSTDGSYSVINQIHQRNPKFRAIRFRRNYGKSAALSAGFAEAKGVIVITMDADLQDDPSEIPNLVAKIREGWDLVSGWKRKRRDPITKTIPSKFFNFITSVCSGLRLHDFNCGLKAYRAEVIKAISVYGEMHRYIPALAKWEGFRITEIPVKHHPRRYGKSKFGFSRFMKGFLDLTSVMFTTRFFKRPLHLFGTLGTFIALLGLGIDIYLVVEWILGYTFLSNRPLALFGIAMIIVGVQLFSFGLIGEMITKQSLEKMNYSVKEKL
jgi:glycosyltransferase involved in cell wall biosynthesis